MTSDVRWVVYGLRPIGEVKAPDRGRAWLEARKQFGLEAEKIQSRASVIVAALDAAMIQRTRRIRQEDD